MPIHVFKSIAVSLNQEHEDRDGFHVQMTPELLRGKRCHFPSSANVAEKYRCDLWIRLIVRQIILRQAADENLFHDVDRQARYLLNICESIKIHGKLLTLRT